MENEPDTLPAESDPGALPPPPDTPLAEGPTMPDAGSPPPHPDPYPFWRYADLVVFFGLAFPCLLLGAFTVKFVPVGLPFRVHSLALELVPAQFLGYGFLFFALYLLFTVHYQRPFWQSLRWVRTRPGVSRTVLYGFVMAFVVALLGTALRTPDIHTPMKDLLSDRSAILLIAIFAMTLGPMCEELAFRGFLQPLLVRSLGPVAGIVLAAIPVRPAASVAIRRIVAAWTADHGGGHRLRLDAPCLRIHPRRRHHARGLQFHFLRRAVRAGRKPAHYMVTIQW